MVGFIDPPSPYAPLADWEAFLTAMLKVRPQTKQIQQAIAEAERQIAELKRQQEK